MNKLVLINLGCMVINLGIYAHNGSNFSLGCVAFSGIVAAFVWEGN